MQTHVDACIADLYVTAPVTCSLSNVLMRPTQQRLNEIQCKLVSNHGGAKLFVWIMGTAQG